MITNEQVNYYKDKGYLVVENAIPQEKLKELQRVTDEYVANSKDVVVNDEVYDLAYLTVESNDPLQPVVIASHEGEAIRGGTITDNFVQEETEEVDILFVIDNSCSMSDHQTSLATNAASFITTLDASGADYRLATITTDDPSFVGPVLYPLYPDITSEFESQLVGSGFTAALKVISEDTNPPFSLDSATASVTSVSVRP